MSGCRPDPSKYRNLEYVSNPTIAANFIGFLKSYARRHGVKDEDVVVESLGTELFVHTGWIK